MSDLLGAWSLDDVPARRRISTLAEARMLARLPGHPEGLAEISEGPLWLVARRGKLSRGPAGVQAHEGLLVGESPPEGHFVLARADLAARRLRLLRGLSGGERLYFARLPGLVLFAASLRPLLAHPDLDSRLRRSAVDETVVAGLTMAGTGTLIEGIEEVPPGHTLTLGREVEAPRWHWPGLLEPPAGDLATLARDYRHRLGHAVERAIGPARPVAVTLSGGIDSSAIAAHAVDCVGAANVEAFTYEFDDPSHPCETPFAVAVARRLGIRHHVFKISFEDYLQALPETVWRAESPTHWPKAFMLPASRRILRHGFTRYLSGFGIGSHMAHLEDLARLLARPGGVALVTALAWRARTRRGRHLHRLRRVHPSLEPLYPRLLLLVLSVLRERGAIADLRTHFPADMAPLLGEGGHIAEAPSGFARMELAAHLRHQSFARLVSCIDVTRWEKVLREIGVERVSPAHFAEALPPSYLPIRPRPNPWSRAGRLRPGKLLLRESMKGVLPEDVLHRRKSWADAVVSPTWYAAGLAWMRSVLPADDDILASDRPGCQSAFNSDPLSACKIDPPPCFDGGCPGSPREGPARLRVALCVTRSEAAWEGPVGPPGQPGRRRNVGIRWGS